MLIVTRSLNEVVKIGNDIDVEVLGIQGGQVKLGFTAPPQITVAERKKLERGSTRFEGAPTDAIQWEE